MRRAGRALAAAAGVVLLLPVLSASAFVPRADRVADAIARTNKADGRAQALRLELNLRIEDGEPVAKGELVTHPTGLARLELRGAGDLVERHVLQGSEHRASRNGRVLDPPRAFLPPLFLLQTDSGVTLRAALAAFGVQADAIGLAPCGMSDCYILGDPSQIIPTLPLEGEPPIPLRDPDRRSRSGDDLPKIWVDTTSFEVLRVDSERGVRVQFGPPTQFEQVRFPSWIQIDEPGKRSVRFEILRATPVNAPASAFGEAWLFGAPTR